MLQVSAKIVAQFFFPLPFLMKPDVIALLYHQLNSLLENAEMSACNAISVDFQLKKEMDLSKSVIER